MKSPWRALLRKLRPEKRSGSPVFGDFGLGPVTAGNYVNARLAENLSTVTACVGAISSTLATLPAYVYRQEPDGRKEAKDHPVSRLLQAPNERQTWPAWLEMMLAQCLLFGNAISIIETDRDGQPERLIPVPWQNVQVFLLPNGRLAYDIVQFIAPWGGTGKPRRYLDGEVFHLKDRSDDGFLGRSRLSRAPDVLSAAIGVQTYASSLWGNAVTPSGVLKTAQHLSKESAAEMAQAFQNSYSGAANAKKTVVLHSGVEFQGISISPEDAEVLASRRFTVEELCRLYQVPPPIVQDYTHNTFTNASQAFLWFAQLTVVPWARKVEAEFQRTVFADGTGDYRLELDLSGLMRGDFEARWRAYDIAINRQILDVNEVREAEGYNPRAARPRPEVPAEEP